MSDITHMPKTAAAPRGRRKLENEEDRKIPIQIYQSTSDMKEFARTKDPARAMQECRAFLEEAFIKELERRKKAK